MFGLRELEYIKLIYWDPMLCFENNLQDEKYKFARKFRVFGTGWSICIYELYSFSGSGFKHDKALKNSSTEIIF